MGQEHFRSSRCNRQEYYALTSKYKNMEFTKLGVERDATRATCDSHGMNLRRAAPCE